MKDILLRYRYKNNGNMIELSREQIQQCRPDFFETVEYAGINTGLQDSNDVDIFEGDIVEVNAFVSDGPIHFENSIQKVHYSNGAFRLKYLELYFFTQRKRVTVIGNVFQNPTLLKVSIHDIQSVRSGNWY